MSVCRHEMFCSQHNVFSFSLLHSSRKVTMSPVYCSQAPPVFLTSSSSRTRSFVPPSTLPWAIHSWAKTCSKRPASRTGATGASSGWSRCRCPLQAYHLCMIHKLPDLMYCLCCWRCSERRFKSIVMLQACGAVHVLPHWLVWVVLLRVTPQARRHTTGAISSTCTAVWLVLVLVYEDGLSTSPYRAN